MADEVKEVTEEALEIEESEEVELSDDEKAIQDELDKEFESIHGVDPQKYQKARDIWLADPTESEYKNNHDIPEPWWDNYFEVDLALPGGHKKYGIKSADDGDFCTQEELDEWAKAQDQSWYITDEKNFHTLETWMARNAISDDEEEE
jgi:hypothetical protein